MSSRTSFINSQHSNQLQAFFEVILLLGIYYIIIIKITSHRFIYDQFDNRSTLLPFVLAHNSINIQLQIKEIEISRLSIMNLRNYSYTADLEKAAQKNKWSDTITQYTSVPPPIEDMRNAPIKINAFPLKHTLCHLLEFEKTLYYFFTSELPKGFKLTIYCFQKDDGQYRSMILQDLKGTPSCITAGFLAEQRDSFKQSKGKNYQYTIALLVGLKQGFIKTITISRSIQLGFQTSVDSTKLEQKSIISIKAADKTYYNNKNICFILLQDSKVFIYNYLIKNTIAIYQPPILSHDFAVCMTFHSSGNYIATCTKSGQIFVWELSERTLKLIQKSEQRIEVQKGASKNSSVMIDQDEQTKWAFRAQDRDLSVFPMYALHSASVNGLKWIQFHGNLLATVSRTGLFRLLVINFSIRDEFIILIQYQIENGQSISSIQLFPHAETLVVTKCKEYVSLVQKEEKKGDYQMTLKYKQNLLKKNDYHSKMNANCYVPLVGRETVIESIQFGSQLRIQKVKRVGLTKEDPWSTIDFKYTILNKDGGFILTGSDQQFFIGTCSQYFSMTSE